MSAHVVHCGHLETYEQKKDMIQLSYSWGLSGCWVQKRLCLSGKVGEEAGETFQAGGDGSWNWDGTGRDMIGF